MSYNLEHARPVLPDRRHSCSAAGSSHRQALHRFLFLMMICSYLILVLGILNTHSIGLRLIYCG
ncbi:hypothetical protein [Paenibacillus sp. FSL H7-0331]|uniref:hypothetical protein n=1 Tax=Paenibacillus sp. FSL H7-0331 TaxID=1920421 RepID=UPI0015C3EA6C|nr:hypothetical protein [Paenibacillus sp. FSL H7-0331]